MSLTSSLLKYMPNKLKSGLKKALPTLTNTYKSKIDPRHAFSVKMSNFLPTITCVDVGASYFPHTAWSLFLNSPQTTWIAADPNSQNLEYLKTWAYPAKLNVCPMGLSENGGTQNLYVTNVDSGSSLYEPVISPSMKHRSEKAMASYFFPVKIVPIKTATLSEALNNHSTMGAPTFVKLDTQGSERSILRGASGYLGTDILGIESEATLLAEPLMKGSGKFWELTRDLEEKGYELIHINPISLTPRYGNSQSQYKRVPNECDATFALRWDIVKHRSCDFKVALFAFYLSYHLYDEAISIFDEASDIRDYFNSRGLDETELRNLILSRC